MIRYSEVPKLGACDLALTNTACDEVRDALEAAHFSVVGLFRREVGTFAAEVVAKRAGVKLENVVLPHGARVERIENGVDLVLVPKRYAFDFARLGRRFALVGMAGLVAVSAVLVSRLAERGRFTE